MAKGMLRRLWDYEITCEAALKQRWVPAWAALTMVIYVLMEVVVLATATVISFSAYLDLRAKDFQDPHSYDFTAQIFPWLYITLLVICVGFRIYIGMEGYFWRPRKDLDQGQFYRNMLVYNPASVGTLGLHFLVAALLGLALLAIGFDFQLGFDFVLRSGADLRLWIQAQIPTIIALPYKWMALILLVTLHSFTAYFEHWLTHKSRFLWHVVHAPHHLPDMLHPLGSPLANNFDFFLIPVRVVVGALMAKLVFAEPLLMESALYALASYCFEIFNHSSSHYDLVSRSRILRFIFKIGGGQGVYHYLHHSSAERHQMVNMGAGIWLIWDRLFGTFEEPPLERPAVGWTDNPEVYHNPIRVVLGGPARILYELRHNCGWKTRFLILFGGVMWNPPLTIDYIKKVKSPLTATDSAHETRLGDRTE
jgi:sterol desaturase/sphingolipid hydroxylase (fatty acid hydroxylase superfamily)